MLGQALVLSIFVVIPLLFFTLIAFGAVSAYKKQLAAAKFIPVTATVTHSELIICAHKNKNHHCHKARIFYRYAVDGKEYQSKRYAFYAPVQGSYQMRNQQEADRAQRYPVGTACKAYYNPQKPGESILSQQHPGSIVVCVVMVGIVVVAWGILIAGTVFKVQSITV